MRASPKVVQRVGATIAAFTTVGTATALTLTSGTPVNLPPGTKPGTPPQPPTELVNEVSRLSAVPTEGKDLKTLRGLEATARRLESDVDTFAAGVRTQREAQERLGQRSTNPVAWVNPFNGNVRRFESEYVKPFKKAEEAANEFSDRASSVRYRFESSADDIDPVVIQRRKEEAQRQQEEHEAWVQKCRNDPDALGCMGFVGF
jgi:hypothetical protein